MLSVSSYSNIMWLFWITEQQLLERQPCGFLEQFHLAKHLFFSSEWFSVFTGSLLQWTAVVLRHWPLLSVFCLHPSSHYTQSKSKPQSMLDGRSSSKQQNHKVKRIWSNLSPFTIAAGTYSPGGGTCAVLATHCIDNNGLKNTHTIIKNAKIVTYQQRDIHNGTRTNMCP